MKKTMRCDKNESTINIGMFRHMTFVWLYSLWSDFVEESKGQTMHDFPWSKIFNFYICDELNFHCLNDFQLVNFLSDESVSETKQIKIHVGIICCTAQNWSEMKTTDEERKKTNRHNFTVIW